MNPDLDVDDDPPGDLSPFEQRLFEQRSARLWAAAPDSARFHKKAGHRIAPRTESGRSWWCMDCALILGEE